MRVPAVSHFDYPITDYILLFHAYPFCLLNLLHRVPTVHIHFDRPHTQPILMRKPTMQLFHPTDQWHPDVMNINTYHFNPPPV